MSALSLFKRTSDRSTWNIASWHSPHSLTWSWILSLRWQPGNKWDLTPRFNIGGALGGFGLGIGHLVSAYAYRNNGGWQLSVCLFWIDFHWSKQRPIWYRDLYQKARNEAEQAKHQLRLNQRFMGVR